jgi:LuxR family maltose regulon positive regulatory protein
LLEILESKLAPRLEHHETVRRVGLLDRLQASASTPVVTVVAPPGYGKTTLLAQWAGRDPRPFAWLSIDRGDNDPAVLLTHIAVALDRVEPIDPAVFDALASPGVSIAGTVVPRLGSALSARALPVVLVLDGVHLLHDRECLEAVTALIGHLPRASQLAMASRGEPPLPVARLRAEGWVAEVGPDDLAMDSDETASLLRARGTGVSDAVVAELHRRTEGWPAALQLAGDDRFLAEYVRSALLSRVSSSELRFLTRTAVLDRMCGPLCDAVVGRVGSAALLESLERSSLLVSPLDRRRRWYRCHGMFRELLREQLERREPGAARELTRRAARWCQDNGLPDEAVEYAMRAADADRVARLVERRAMALYDGGRIATLRRWLAWFDDNGLLERYPAVTALGAWVHTLSGDVDSSERWADAAERGSSGGGAACRDPVAEGSLALLRAMRCRNGVRRMRADAEAAVSCLPTGHRLRATALLLLGISHLLAGDLRVADSILAGAVEAAEDTGGLLAAAVGLAERAVVAMALDEWGEAEELGERARSIGTRARLDGHAVGALLDAVAARLAIHRGQAERARELLARVQHVRPRVTHALSFYAVQVRLELARAYTALTDVAGARTVLREVGDLLLRRPDLGVLSEQAAELRSRLDLMRADVIGASSLTGAELRLLPQLATHHSFREIGVELHLSPHTVKTQAIAIYRKFGVSSRSQAIQHALRLRLLASGPAGLFMLSG